MPDFLTSGWILALRFLRDGRMQTLFIVAGTSLGVAVIVFMSALLGGMQDNIIRRTLSSQPHIVIQPPELVARPLRGDAAGELAVVQPQTQRLASIDQWRAHADEIRGVPGVTVVTAIASGPAFAIRGGTTKSVALAGVEPDEYTRVVSLADKIVAGTYRLAGTDVLVGTELAKDLGVGLGDKLRIATATGADTTLAITGVFDLGSRGANDRNVYVLLRTAQDLLGLVGGASNLYVDVTDLFAAETVAQTVAARTGLKADSWIATNAQLFSAINAQTLSNLVIRAAVGLSVALGIASVLAISVVQRSHDIGILRAMGGTRRQMMNVFLIQGGLVGASGSLVGSALAAVFVVAWRGLAKAADGTPLFPVSVEPSLIGWAALLATATGVVAAVMPARRAAALDPVVAIRG